MFLQIDRAAPAMFIEIAMGEVQTRHVETAGHKLTLEPVSRGPESHDDLGPPRNAVFHL